MYHPGGRQGFATYGLMSHGFPYRARAGRVGRANGERGFRALIAAAVNSVAREGD